MSRYMCTKLKTVARITELFQYKRFLILFCYIQMLVDVGFGVCAGFPYIFLNAVFRCPAPVIGPDVDVHVVDVRIGMDLLEESDVFLASVLSFASRRNQVVRVERTDECGCPAYPSGKGFFMFGGESTRLVSDLPRHDGRVFRIFPMGISVGTGEDVFHVVGEQGLCAV